MARDAAAESALTLRDCPCASASGAIDEITGIWPASRMASTTDGSTAVTSPTSPRSTASPFTTVPRRVPANRPSVSPDSARASIPCESISAAISGPTWAVSTSRTTARASAEVTRSPPRNSLGIPRAVSSAVIWGPPPCTTTGRTPTWRKKTISSAKACLSSSLTMALPPNFTTMVLPWNRCSHGSDSMRADAFADASLECVPISSSTRCSRARSRG